MYPIVIRDEDDLAREIARIANIARQLGLKIKSENRDMTQDEAYTELSHSASLLRAVLSYAKEKKEGRQLLSLTESYLLAWHDVALLFFRTP